MRLTPDIRSSDTGSRSDTQLGWRVKALPRLLSTRVGLFVCFNLLYGGLFAGHFGQLFRFSLTQKDYPHFYIIPLISLALMFRRRTALLVRADYWGRGGGLLVLAGGLCYVLGLSQQSYLSDNDFLALTSLGTVIVWIGGFAACFGPPGMCVVRFALGFLLLSIPLPEAGLSWVITTLQHGSAEVTAWLFTLTHLPVFREGLHFVLPRLSIEVAEACSSIRSSIALLITCLLASHLMLRRWWSKAIVLLLVFPLAVFKNGVRIVSLCLLTLYVDEGFITGHLHTRGGAVFFALSLVILGLIVLGLQKLEVGRPNDTHHVQHGPTA
jgi:exosortase